ncbi:MAG: ChrR family anti-sigma-E factor [Alphaproteobacteria bacterium]|nr:ChrR family anti-sigma-E factor [Alphaproteobacteria bacterium]
MMTGTMEHTARTPQHHPDSEFLMDYAGGALREPLAVLIATHLSFCGRCRAEVARLEALGGSLMEGLPRERMSAGSLGRLLRRLDREGEEERPMVMDRGDPAVPYPLRPYLARLGSARGGGWANLPWKKRLKDVGEITLLDSFPGFQTRLMRIAGGSAVPAHTHGGMELTLVLEGGFSDSTGQYLPGDVAYADDALSHQPVADEGHDCICLAVTDAPLKLTGPIARLFNPFIRS